MRYFDWQIITVLLIICAACVYVARRAWARLRSFLLTRGANASTCATGCGKCGDEAEPAPLRPRVLVQLERSKKA